jgi:succinate dehydrogenase / fumarate reductase iron-sulfur subunit
MTVVSCLQWIAANPKSTSGQPTTPPAFEAECMEETCGACAMVINGRVRPACSAFVDKLGDAEDLVTLEPMSKFPVVRDLVVDRSRFYDDLKRIKAWVPIDGSHDLGAGPLVMQRSQERNYALSRCIGCGCCVEACPQYTRNNHFVGAAVINQARLFNEHQIAAEAKAERLETLMGVGGVQDCGNAANCVAVCPKEIPLLESIATVQRQATVHTIKKFFGG